MLIKKIYLISKNSEKNKIMIWGIHYFIEKLKTKIDPKELLQICESDIRCDFIYTFD